jgi:hypothetical protein
VSASTLSDARADDSWARSGNCASVPRTPKCQPCVGLSETTNLIVPTADIAAAAGGTA